MELLFYLRISIIIIYYRKLGFGLSSWHVSPLRLWHVTSLVFFLLLTKFILFIRDFLLFFLKKKTCIYTCHVHNQLIIKYKCWWFHGAGSRWGRGVERSGQFSRVGWRVQKTHITRPWELICLIQLMLRGQWRRLTCTQPSPHCLPFIHEILILHSQRIAFLFVIWVNCNPYLES